MTDESLIRKRSIASVWSNLLGRLLLLPLAFLSSVIIARFLGPSLLSKLVTIRAMAATATVFSDLGLSTSLPKVIPYVSTRYGNQAASSVVSLFNNVRLCIFPAVFAVMIISKTFSENSGGISYFSWYAVLISFLLAAFSILNNTYKYAAISALRNKQVVTIEIIIAISGAILQVLFAVLWNSPYWVAWAIVITQAANLVLIRKYAIYDLDVGLKGCEISFGYLIKKFWKFFSVSYLKFIFNKFVIRNPMLVWAAILLNISSDGLGNASIALSIVFQAWQIANMPLAQIRAPLLARFHAQEDYVKQGKLQSVSVALIVISSSLLAIFIFILGLPLASFLYGENFYRGCQWGVNGAVVALIGNFFSLGNNTAHQMEKYKVQIVGLVLAVLFIVAGVICLGIVKPENTIGLIVYTMIGGRIVFWVFTDIVTDQREFNWKGSMVKVRGLLALGLLMLVLFLWNKDIDLLVGSLIVMPAILFFLLVFRLIGGVGDEARKIISGLLNKRIRWAANFI